MPQVIFPGGSGGGSFSPCTDVCRKFILGENCTAGDVVRVANSFDAPVTNGQVLKALATNDYQSDVIGVLMSDGVAGDEVRVIFDGSRNLTFAVAPLISQTGSDVYLDSNTVGIVTLTAPSGSGRSVIRIGKVLFADGIATTVLCRIDIDFICSFS